MGRFMKNIIVSSTLFATSTLGYCRNHMNTETPDVSEKKYGVADYQYFQNGNTQQCNIFRHNKYNIRLVVCEISISLIMSNVTKVMTFRRMMVNPGLDYQTTFTHKRIL